MGDFYGNIIDWNLLAGLNGYLFNQYGQSNIKGVLDENYELYRYDEKYDLSLFKRI